MRLIDAEKLWMTTEYVDGKEHKYYEQFEVDNAPTIDAEPVRHGKWIEMSDADGHYYACSECGEELHREWSFNRKYVICFPKKITIDKTPYCPNCGAKMDEETT